MLVDSGGIGPEFISCADEVFVEVAVDGDNSVLNQCWMLWISLVQTSTPGGVLTKRDPRNAFKPCGVRTERRIPPWLCCGCDIEDDFVAFDDESTIIPLVERPKGV